MRSDKLRRHCDARASDSHSIHAHGEPGRDATQFRRFQALRWAWLTTCHFPDVGSITDLKSAASCWVGMIEGDGSAWLAAISQTALGMTLCGW